MCLLYYRFADDEPKRHTVLASSIEDDDGVLYGDSDEMDPAETIGTLEDDDDVGSIENDSNEEQEEVYYPGTADDQSKAGFSVEDKSGVYSPLSYCLPLFTCI